MFCPICINNSKLKIIDSKPNGKFSRIRQYKCPACDYQNLTTENMEVSKKDQNQLLFNPSKTG
jgi:transcriptional regulator NrdR family protein